MRRMKNVKGVMIDIDGVLCLGHYAIPGAVEAVEYLQQNYKCAFVTNTTRKSRRELYEKLSGMGFPLKEEQVFSAKMAAIEYAKAHAIRKAFFLLEKEGINEFEKNGIKAAEDAAAVIVGLDMELTYEKLNKAFLLLRAGRPLIAMSMDRAAPLGKVPSIAVGPIVKALEYATGAKAIVLGKPGAEFFRLVLHHLKTKPGNSVMIGDTLESDIAGAKNAAMRSILVRTGNYSKGTAPVKPSIILDSIADIRKVL